MEGLKHLEQLNTLMVDKAAKLDLIHNLMQSLDEQLDTSLLIAATERIDLLFKQVQQLDLLFLNNLQRFLNVNGVSSLKELPLDGLSLLKQTQELIRAVEALMKAVEGHREGYAKCKQVAERAVASKQSHVRAQSAYGKFTKK